MNKYSSIERRHWARNIYETTIPAASADIVLANGNFVNQIVRDSFIIEPHTNLLMRRLGVYSNFADGLVWKNPSEFLFLTIEVHSVYQDSAPTGTQNVTLGSKTLTGTLLTTDFGAGNFVWDTTAASFYRINSLADAANGTLDNYASRTSADSFIRLLPISDALSVVAEVRTLNEMYEVEEFFNPLVFGAGANTPEFIVIDVRLASYGDVTFLTKSINTDFEGDPVYFDVALDLEYTPNPDYF